MYKRAPGNDDLRQLRPQHFGLVGIFVTTILLLGSAGCGDNFKYTGDHPDKDNYALKISPSAAVVSEGHTLHLTATSPWGTGATWTVLPASLGSFDNQGNFTAGSTLGTGEIVAMWNGDVRYTATAALLVTGSIAVVTNLPSASAAATVNTPATASVPAQAGLTYQWAVPGGTIEAGQGTPQIQFTSTVLGSVAITCVLTDAAGDSTTDESTVTVIDVPPAVHYSPAVYSFTRGQLIAPILPISSGGAPVTWSIAPGLLSGLAFDPQTGQITGTPAILSPPVTYSVTATNSGGSVTTTVAIASMGETQAIAYNPANYVLTRGNAIQAIVPNVTGGTFASWSISAALPVGLLFDGTTGIVTGTPTVLSSAATYTVTATNPGGAGSTAAVTLSIIDRAPVIHYTPSALSLTKGVSFPPLSPTNTGGAALGWTISPTLPAGLAFDTTTGTLSGAPTGLNASATYTVTASNTGGASNAAIITIVAVDIAPAIVYNPNVFVFIKGTGIPPVVPLNNGGAALLWSIASALPAGLVFDPATGRISGTPTVLSAANNYSVTASNSGGASAASILTLSVVDVAPLISYPAPAYTLSIDLPAPTMTPSNTGGSAVSWNISPALLPGLVFAPATGVITGAPTTLLPSTVFSVTATNSGGTSLPFPFTLTVVATAAASIAASNVNPLYAASIVLTPTFTGAVSAKVGTSQGGSDLSASAVNSAAITTAALTSPVTFWLRVTNAAGDFVDSSVTVTPQTVVVGAVSPAAPTRTLSTATTFSATATGGVTDGITWTASAGIIDAATGIWTAPATAGNVTITATSKDDLSRSANTTVSVVAPATASITASTATPLYGATATLTPAFSGAVSSTVGTTQGGSDISASPVSGVAITTAAITSAKTYWLRATNAAGGFVDASVAVTPQTVVVAAITPAAPARTISTFTTFSTTATGGVTNGIAWTASAGAIDANLGVWTAPAAVGNVTITATSKDDATKSATTLVNLVAVATSAITASTSTPLRGATVTVTPTFTGAVSAKVGTSQGGSDLSASAVSGAAITTAALTSPVTFWLRVTNAAGDFVDSSVTVTPQTVAVGAISPAAPTRTVGSPNILFTATATGGVTNGITWSASGGATINAGTGAWIVPATAQSVVITATSNDDATRNSTTTVTVAAVATAVITASNATPLYGATVNVTPAFTNAVTATVGTTAGAADISAAATSGSPITTAAITTVKTYWLRATNSAGSFVDASVIVTPQTVVVGAITPALPTRTVSTATTFIATASGGVTNSVTWTASAGTIDANLGVWTAPASPGNVTISATSNDNGSKVATTTVIVVAAATGSIVASNTNPADGATVTVTPTFTGATSAKVGTSQGASNISASAVSGTAIATTAITTAKTYWLRATNAAGDFVDSSVTVTPQTVAVGAISPAAPTRTISSTSVTFAATATGGVTNGITWSASGSTTINAVSGVWTVPATPQSVVITATSNDDATRSATTTVTVVAVPTASIVAFTNAPLYGATDTVTPTFSNAVSETVGTTQGGNDVSTAPTSGSAITTAAITTAKTYWLRATNAAGSYADASVTLTPVVAVAAITAGSTNVSVGLTTTLKTTVTGAVDTTVNWTGTGSFSPANTASAANTTWTAPSTPGVNTLTATSDANATTTRTIAITVVALPVATSLTASTTSPLYGATITLTPAFTVATGVTASVNNGVGAVTNGTGKTSLAITAATTFTLTVTNAALQTATVASALVTPQTVSVGVPSPAGGFVTTSHTQVYTTVVTGASNSAVTWSATGGSFAAATWTAPSTTGSYTITATSVADPTKSNTTTVTVVSPPVITSFTAAPQLAALNFASILTPVFTNGTGSAYIGSTGNGSQNLTNAAVSTTGVSTGALSTTTTYTLTVYNQAGNSTSAALTVTVVPGSSVTTGSLTGARYNATGTILPGGRVLIAGGRSAVAAPLNTSELYDPVAASFSSAGTMVSARYGQTATLLANNTVLITGGNSGSTTALAELWNSAFAATGALNSPREEHTATLLPSGQVLVVGGLNGSAPVVTAELYNPSTGTFSYTAGNLNTARYSHSATLLANGKVLISGGFNGTVALNSAELFDPSTGAFTVTGSMATARQRHAAVLLNDGTVAMIGGEGASAPLGSAEIFNSTTNTFAAASGSMANVRDSLTATLIANTTTAAGKVIAAGGVNASATPVQGSEIFDATAGTFALSALLATARTQHTANLLQSGKILLAGGLTTSGATLTAELLDPQDGAIPVVPNAAITAPAGASEGQAGLVASVPAQTHVRYVWMITGGTITAGSGTNSIVFTMPPTGTATLDVLLISDRLVPSQAQFVVTPVPVISAFSATKSTVTVATATNLNWTVQGATSLSINQGIGAVSGSAAPVTVASLGSNTYTLTATNAGGSVTATTSIVAVPAPVATSLTAAASSVAVGGNTTLTPIFSAGTGSIDQGMGAVVSGPAYPTATIAAQTTFTLTVTNAAGDTAQAAATVGLQAVSVTSVNGPAYISAGHTAAYTATVTGAVNTAVTWSAGAGTIDASGNLTAPSGSPYNATQTPLTITATSLKGGTPASLTVQVVPMPAIASFASSPVTANYGGATSMTPAFTNGTGQILNLGSVTSGQPVSSGLLTASKTFTLQVTDLAGDSVTQALTIAQSTLSVSTPTTASGAIVTTGDVVLFSAASNGSSNPSVTWAASGGAFSGASWTAPAVGTYTITASSVSPAGYSANTTITVVAVPAITSFTSAASTISPSASTTLTAAFAGGTATVSPGAVTPTSGAAFSTGNLSATTIYTLVVSNAATVPRTVTQSLIVNVVKGVATTSSATMATGRAQHTVTLLASGNVLIAGGSYGTGAELYNATNQTISELGSQMTSVRFGHTATLLANGKVLIAGGTDANNVLNTAEIFDPVSNTFTATTRTMTDSRYLHTAALMRDGRVLLAGGQDNGGSVVSSAEIYDPVADSFTAATSMSQPQEFATATTLQNGGVLLAGGDNGESNNTAQVYLAGSYNSYLLTQARSQHTATLLPGGKVFLAGGMTLEATLNSTEAFNGTAFSTTAHLLTARYGHVANLLASGLVYLAGGAPSDNPGPMLTSAELYDPAQNQLFSTGSLNTGRFEAGSTLLRNGTVVVIGGASDQTDPDDTSFESIELFNPQDSLTPVLPVATLTAPASAPAGTTGLVASVPAQANVSYVWSITNGAITSGINTSSIVFTKATGGSSILSVLVVSDRQIPVAGSATISLAPSITAFTATPSTNTTGLSTTLAWTASGASGLALTINNGVGAVTSLGGTTTVTTPATATTYTLTATDVNGTATRSVTLNVVGMPVATSLTAAVNPIQKGSSTTILPIFTTNGSATVDNSVGAVLSGVAYPTGTLASSTTFTLTVANTVGTAVTRTLAVAVMPVVVGAISGPANVSVNSTSAQFSATVTGAVNAAVTWSTSAGAITAGGLLTAPAAVQQIVVTATSVADVTQHNQTTVNVVALGVATSITAATNPVLYGGSTTITPQFSQGTGSIDQGIGNVTSGVAYTTGIITAAKTFTLTVTNASGDTATFPYTVLPQTVVVSTISGPPSGKVTESLTTTFTASVTGAVNTSLTWSAGAGSFAGAVWTAPVTPGSYTITATAVNGASNTLFITAVAAPAIASFTATPAGINKNQSSTLTATFSGAGTGMNATGVITPGGVSLASGGAGVSTGALTATQTYTLTVTDDAGDTATATTTVQVFLGAFSATSNGLNPARNLPTATLRPDGNVLVAGGATASNAADVFDGTALSFSSNAAVLLTGRSQHTATLLPNGLILVAGGYNGTSALASAELYNPATGIFTAAGTLAQARRNHRAVLLDSGQVLLAGGTGLSSAELYNPVTGLFTLTSSMASVRESATASRLPDGRVLVAGGLNGSTRLASAEIFDPSTNTFSNAAAMLQARALHTATILPSGQILIAGGTGGVGAGSAELFNPSLARFAGTGNMVQPRQEQIATMLAGGMVLIAGGNSGLSPNAIDQAELFDPSQGAFLKTDFMSTTGAPATGAAATILGTGAVVVTGGTSNGASVVAGSELYTSTDGLTSPAASASITAAAYVPQGATAVAAHVIAVADARYIWMVTNATLVSGQGTPSITLNMAASGNATLDILIITDRFVPAHGRAVVVGEPAPSITSFTAAATPVPYGGSTSVTPAFANGLGGSVIGTGAAGTSDITSSAASGVAVPVGPLTAPVQFRLTVTNRASISVNQTVTVNVESVIVSALSPANPAVSAGSTTAFSAGVSQAVNSSVVWSATGGTMNAATGAWIAPATAGTYTITATAAANGTTSSSTTATVVALPAIQSFLVSPASLSYGQAAMLTPTFTGSAGSQASIGTTGTGSSQLTSTATSGVPVSTGALTANVTYTLTATNSVGTSVTATATVTVTQPFTATGAMNLARLGQTTTLLPDGTALVAGGTGAADKAEIYSAGTGAFAYTQAMQSARAGHTATLLATGQVLLTGGSNGAVALSSAELYDPVAQSFTATAGPMVHARQNHVAALLADGRVLIAGGFNATENQLASAEIFDPATGTFSAVATSLASARQFATATALNDGRILIAGGFNGAIQLTTAELFSSGAFSNPAISMGSARSYHTATLLPSGNVLLAGGFDGSNRLATATLFTPGAPGTFSATGSMAQSRQAPAAALLAGGEILLAGGTSGTTARSSADLFNSTTTNFAPTGNLITPRSGAGSTLLLDGTVLVEGGTTDGTTPIASAERYNPQDSLIPFRPNATIVPSVTHAEPGTAGLTATVPANTGNLYVWFLANGTITAGQGTATVTFTMATSGNAVLNVLVTSDHLVPAQGQVTVTADPLPVLTSFVAAMNPIPYGGSTTLTVVFSNATGVTLGTAGYGSSDVSTSLMSGSPIAIGPLTSSVAYTVTLPTVDGNMVSSTLIVNLQAVAVSPVTPASPNVTVGHTQTFNAVVTQAANTAITWSATGGTIVPATGAWTAPSTPGTYTIKATAAADNMTFATTTVTVVSLPSITSFTVSPAAVNYGEAASATPVFIASSGIQASIGTSGAGSSQLTANATSGTAISTGALGSTTTFTLTVANAAGDSATGSALVTVNQPFSPTGSMALARSGQTTTQLPDGSVLVAGGTGAADKAEIYAGGAFTFTGAAMQVARTSHTATLMADGTVLFTGGSDGVNTLSSAEVFDPSTGVFTNTTGTMIHARQSHSAALLADGRVLLIGGFNPTDSQLSSAEVFDPTTGLFTALPSSLVVAREFATATTLPNGDVLVAGGTGTGATPLASAELYSAGAFAAQSFSMTSARTHHTATLLATGEVLLAGGDDGFSRLQSAELYTSGSTASSLIATTGSMNTGREQQSATVLASGKVLLAGGFDGTVPLASAEVFDPTTQTFAAAGTLGTPRMAAGAALLPSGIALIEGGTGASATALSSAELFDAQDGLTPDLSGVALSAPSSASFGSTQTAAVTLPAGAFCIWSVENGTVTSGSGTSSVTFTTGTNGSTIVRVLVYTRVGLPILATQVVAGH
jgi:hypothetical protein